MHDIDSTREIDTLDGPKLYNELVPVLALGVERVSKALVVRGPDDLRFSFGQVVWLHEEAFKEVVAWAGQIRNKDVAVGRHLPPPFYLVRNQLKEFADTLEYRVARLDLENLDPHEVVDIFATCEGRFTNIHPFRDFNGRVSRMLSWMLVLRLRLPPSMLVVPPDGDLELKRELFETLFAQQGLAKIDMGPAFR